MSPAARVQLAYRLAGEAAARLRDETNDAASGDRLLIRAAVVNLTATLGPIDASDFVLRLAEEALNTRKAS
jgi:hypothetical protein